MRIEERGTIYDATAQPAQRRVAFFTSLCPLHDGTMLCGFQVGRAKHAPDSTVCLYASADGGRIWEPRSTRFESNFADTPGSLATAELVEVAPSRLLLFATWFDRSDPERPLFDPATGGILHSKLLVADSTDAGRTFSTWRELPTEELTGCSFTGPVLRFADGMLALPFESYKEYDDPCPGHHAAWVMVSCDGGASFSRPLLVAQHPEHRIYYWDQRLCVGRWGNDVTALFWSHDLEAQRDLNVHLLHPTPGESEQGEAVLLRTPVQATPLRGQIAAPLWIDDDRLMAFVVDRQSEGTMMLCVSRDGGKTWPAEGRLVVYSHKQAAAAQPTGGPIDYNEYWEQMGQWTFGHPAIRKLSDDRLLLAWYAGTPDCMSIHWARVAV